MPEAKKIVNFQDALNKINELNKNKDEEFQGFDKLKDLTDDDYIKLGDWWSKSTKLPGIPFRRITLIAGTSDSGKSSIALQTIRAAQAQGFGVIYIETENKTTESDFIAVGIDPKGVVVRQSFILEEAFEAAFAAWDQIKKVAPEIPMVLIIDSIGNATTLYDDDLDLTDKTKPGGKGTATRRAMNKLACRVSKSSNPVAVLLISYTYANIGSKGKTNAGGDALHFFPSLIYQTSRRAWYEKQVDGQKVRAGADVIFSLYKNHIKKHDMGAKKITFRITKDGFQLLETADAEAVETEEQNG